MSTFLSLGHAISVMRQFLFCWSTHDVKAIETQFLVCLYAKIRKKFEILIILNITDNIIITGIIIVVVVDGVIISKGNKEVHTQVHG